MFNDYRNMPGPGDFLPPEYSLGWKDPDIDRERKIESDYADLLAGEKVTFGNGSITFDSAIENDQDDINKILRLLVNAKPETLNEIALQLQQRIKDALYAEAESIA